VTTTNALRSGDAANHTLRLVQDGVSNVPSNSPAEVDAINAPGLYQLAITSAEASHNVVTIAGFSSGLGGSVSIWGTMVTFTNTINANVTAWGGQTAQTNAGLPIVTTALSGSPGGLVNANLVSISGYAVSITSAGYLSTDVEQWQGLQVRSHISGIPDTNTLYWDSMPAQVDANDLPSVNMQDINGGSISAQLADQIVTVIAVASGAAVSTPNLQTYLTDVQNLLGVGGTTTQNLYTSTQLIGYINKARLQIAGEGQCVRALTPISNGIVSITVLSGGGGYTTPPNVIITQPDSPSGSLPFFAGVQATATATISGNVVNQVTVVNPGAGYFEPVVSFTSGGGGFGATAMASVASVAQTVTFQEVYPYSAFNPLIQATNPGVDRIIQVNSINTIWGTFRYTLIHKSFSAYQSYARTYTAGYYYIPTVWAQYGQGDKGSFYLYPVPNQAYQLELDCFCLPLPLNTNTDVEAIPAQWTDAVPFLAAYYAYTGSQRMADADRMWQEAEKFIKRARQQSQSHGTVNPYGRA
jgi:hypothetical protein